MSTNPNAPKTLKFSSGVFSHITDAPPDPILGLTEAYKLSTHPKKQNLGPGVYMDETGSTPVLRSVMKAAARLTGGEGYLPIAGNARFVEAARNLVFGNCSALKDKRVVGLQAVGGTGAVSLAAHLGRRFFPDAIALISNPSWPNHRGIFSEVGTVVNEYAYYNVDTRAVGFDKLMSQLKALSSQAIVVLHAGCHNPTGCDFSDEQWETLANFFVNSPHIPLIDAAYIGFKEGLEADRRPITLFADKGVSCFVAASFSKSFSLYSQRIGALFIVTNSDAEARKVEGQAKSCIRTLWSNPPAHGAALVETVLNNPDLRSEWEGELGQMRDRIRSIRHALVDAMQTRGVDFSHLRKQHGMFSFTGLSPDQVEMLALESGIFMTSNGRLAVPALNPGNLEIVADAIAAAVRR